MHPDPAFRKVSDQATLAFVRDRSFGTLAVTAEGGPLLSHVPFLMSEDGASADLHLVRSNPIARLDDVPAVIAVSGPDGYVSPDWYGIGDQVPTWNYVAVHLRGRLGRLPDDAMRDMLERRFVEVAEGTARLLGANAKAVYERGYPVTANHPRETTFAAEVAAKVAGADKVDANVTPVMGGEDFSYMLEARPGAFIFMGIGPGAGLHNPGYDFNDEAIPHGTSFWAQLVETAMPAR